MSFFGIGPMEMVVVAVVGLMLFNPRELPKMLRSLAKFWGQLRATADEFKDTIMTADGVDEIQELVKGTKGQIRQVETDARRELMKARAEMRKAQQKLLKANQAKLEKQTRERDSEKSEPTGGSTDDADATHGEGGGHDHASHDHDSHGHDSHDHDSHGHDSHGSDDAPVAARAPHDRGEPSAASAEPDTDDGRVAATPPHERKPAVESKPSGEFKPPTAPSAPKPPMVSRPPMVSKAPSATNAATAPKGEDTASSDASPATGGAGDDAHNQGAA